MMKITRKQAKSQGQIYYFTGKSCKYNHTSYFYTSNGRCVECTRQSARKSHRKYRERYAAATKQWRHNNPKKSLIYYAKLRARKRNLEFDLSTEDIKIPKTCPCCGVKIQFNIGKHQPNSVTLDRVDNAKGYTKNNVVVLCRKCNRQKSDATISELINLINFLSSLQNEVDCFMGNGI